MPISTMYFNFFAIGSLIPVFFTGLFAVVFFRIRNKSKATLHLAISFLYLSLFYFAYFIATVFYHPMAAHHRWLTVICACAGELHFTALILSYPNDKKYRKFTKIVLYCGYFISALVFAYFAFNAANASHVFHFYGHYWDFEIDKASKIVGYWVVFELVVVIFAGIWKFFTVKNRQRWIVLTMGVVIGTGLMVPAVANVLSRDGLIDRATYHNTQYVFTILAFFVVAVLYINNTKEKTPFMVKILGITLATFLLFFQGINFYTFKNLDKAYNEIHYSDMALFIKTGDSNEQVKYGIKYSITDGIETFSGDFAVKDSFLLSESHYKNALIVEKIKKLNPRNAKQDFMKIMETAGVFFAGYRNDLLHNTKIQSNDGEALKTSIIQRLKSIERQILYRRNQVLQIPADNFRENVIRFLNHDKLTYFSEAVAKEIKASGLQNNELKMYALRFYAPAVADGSRIYRKTLSDGRHYISYMYANTDKNTVYEIGYSYIEYRKYIDRIAGRFTVMLLVMLALILLAFPLFFRRSMLVPIRNLLNGLREIRKGNLKVRIKEMAKDEFGVMASSFNEMAVTIHDATENLEETVRKRTAEVVKQRDDIEQKNVELQQQKEEILSQRDAIELQNAELYQQKEEITAQRDAIETQKEEVRLQKRKLEIVNENLKASIRYALTIQNAILPAKATIDKYFESFIIYHPKDIVSGDFYWFTQKHTRGVKQLFLAVVDCTGHGVPGAFMSMIGSRLLSEIIIEKQYLSPAEILEQLDKGIRKALKQDRSANNDGMDVCLCRFDTKENGQTEVTFSGAKRPLIFYRQNEGEIRRLQGSRKSIGGVKIRNDKIQFVEHTLTFSTHDLLYLSTDGYIDQNNPERRRFGTKRFISLIKQTVDKPLQLQEDRLELELNKHQQNAEQRDDITVLGLRLIPVKSPK